MDGEQVPVESSDLPEVDFRCVSVLWHENEPYPEITHTSCSIYEAIGLLIAAADYLRMKAAGDFEGQDPDE